MKPFGETLPRVSRTTTIFVTGKRQGVGHGRPISVPDSIQTYVDLREVISQLEPIEIAVSQSGSYGFDKNAGMSARTLAFAYFLGVMLGDMSKRPSRSEICRSMSVMLKLSQRHRSNLRFGSFVALCAGMIGIRMKRIKDHFEVLSSGYHYHAFVWLSQSSELLMWIFEKCLGLRAGETTTRNPIRGNWLLSAPVKFQAWFLQGLADSDGYVDLNKHEIGIVVEPNRNLIAKILDRLRVRFRHSRIKGQSTFLMSLNEGFRLPIFSPFARPHKFELMKKLVKARRFRGPWPRWLRHDVDRLVSLGKPSGEVILTILDKHNVAIRSQHIRQR